MSETIRITTELLHEQKDSLAEALMKAEEKFVLTADEISHTGLCMQSGAMECILKQTVNRKDAGVLAFEAMKLQVKKLDEIAAEYAEAERRNMDG